VKDWFVVVLFVMSGGTNLLLATGRGCTEVTNSTRRGYVALALALDANSVDLTNPLTWIGVECMADHAGTSDDKIVIIIVVGQVDAVGGANSHGCLSDRSGSKCSEQRIDKSGVRLDERVPELFCKIVNKYKKGPYCRKTQGPTDCESIRESECTQGNVNIGWLELDSYT
jgi:hypothetical protein